MASCNHTASGKRQDRRKRNLSWDGAGAGRYRSRLKGAATRNDVLVCTELPDDVERFLGSLVAFAEARDDVRAVALIGSHARGVARPDSDVDVVMLTTEPEAYIDGCDWLERFPGATLLATRRWGPLTERRLVLGNEREVDFGVARTSWASIQPLDPGTARVARDGLVALHDPDRLLADVVAAAT